MGCLLNYQKLVSYIPMGYEGISFSLLGVDDAPHSELPLMIETASIWDQVNIIMLSVFEL